MKNILWLILSLAVVNLACAHRSCCAAENQTGDQPAINDQKTCEKMGGRWERLGMSYMTTNGNAEQCNLSTQDSGKICDDDSQCEGKCIVNLSEEQKNMVINGGEIKTTGQCSQYKLNFGCFPVIQDGVVKHIMCVD